MNDEKQKIDDIVAMLDQFMSEGGGHMNVVMNEDALINEKAVETFRSADCGTGNMACQVPTLHQGIDDGEEEDGMDESYGDEED